MNNKTNKGRERKIIPFPGMTDMPLPAGGMIAAERIWKNLPPDAREMFLSTIDRARAGYITPKEDQWT